MKHHLKHWEYFIELSCFVPTQMIKVLSESTGLKAVSSTAFSRIVTSAKCARTREGLETIMLLVLQDYIDDEMTNNPSIFDKFLENIDKQLEELKTYWAEEHVII
jgi:hypothetical protein